VCKGLWGGMGQGLAEESSRNKTQTTKAARRGGGLGRAKTSRVHGNQVGTGGKKRIGGKELGEAETKQKIILGE